MSDGLKVELVFDITSLGVLGAEKFAASREIIEKGADLDLGSGRFAAVADCFDFPARH